MSQFGDLMQLQGEVAIDEALRDLEFWILVQPDEGSEVHWWEHDCFRCGRTMTVWWCVQTPPWSRSRPEEEPLVIAAVLADCENQPPMAYLEFTKTKPRPNGYMGFHCPAEGCGIISGDFHLYRELKKFITFGRTHIVLVSGL